MAVPVSKRRKLSHSPSEEDQDSAFFASFDGLEDEVARDDDEEQGAPESTKELETEIGDGSLDGEEEESGESENEHFEEDDADVQPPGNGKLGVTSKNGAIPQKRSTTSTGSAASMSLTGGSFKSNMFKLQVDELLAEIRPRHGKKEAAAEDALHKVKAVIERLPPRDAQSVADAERELVKKHKVTVPFPDPRPPLDAQYKLEFQTPKNINVVGSYALKMHSRTDPVLDVDMIVTMPAATLQDKDYLNHRYLYKRAYFLACIAAGLRKELAGTYETEFVNLHDNPLKPIITVRPRGSKSNAWRIRIIPAITGTTFASEKLLPSKNAVRPSKANEAHNGHQTLPATPFYNSSIQADAQMAAYLKLLHSASSSCEAYKDACLLGRTWLRQRGFSSSISGGGFGSFEFAASVAILLHTGGANGAAALSPGYSSYQLFKATLQYLSARDLVKQPAILQAGNAFVGAIEGTPVLFDGARNHNVLFKMTRWSYKQLRISARTSLAMLGDSLHDQFENTFILREDVVHQKYDVTAAVPSQLLSSAPADDRSVLEVHEKLYSVLGKGLGDRVTEIALRDAGPPSWEMGAARPASRLKGETIICLTVNPANVSRTVDHGPPAEKKKEAAEFRKFWGEKAELRRFKDGSILESLVWSSDERAQTVLQQIICHLLERHFGAAAVSGLKFLGDGFGRLVRQSNGLAAFQPLMDAYKTLEDDIRGMQDLPLSVRQLAPADPQLRYSSIDPPLGSTQRMMKTPANVVLQFESSGRWPDDLVAIQRTKIAFLLRMSELFQEVNSDIVSRVGLENPTTGVLNQAYLDIIYPTGPAFRLRIHHDREQTLIERNLRDKTAPSSSREAAAAALASYRRHFLKSPSHTQALQKLCTRYPALSPSIRLTKKWFASHLLTNHLSAEVIELFVLRVFTHPWPWTVPSNAKTGFLRTLALLARWDWRADPLIVDSGDLEAEAVKGIQTRFEAWRKVDPALNRVVLFVASDLDPDGETWTDGAVPSKVVAGRMSALARAATKEVVDGQLGLEAASLFASPLEDYDFVLHISTAFAEGHERKSKKTSRFKNLVVQEEAEPENVGFAPVELFADEVAALYGSAVMLFHGGKESRVIAGLWSPFAAKRPWKVNLGYSTLPLAGEDEGKPDAVINTQAILGEIARLGGEMVERIVVNR